MGIIREKKVIKSNAGFLKSWGEDGHTPEWQEEREGAKIFYSDELDDNTMDIIWLQEQGYTDVHFEPFEEIEDFDAEMWSLTQSEAKFLLSFRPKNPKRLTVHEIGEIVHTLELQRWVNDYEGGLNYGARVHGYYDWKLDEMDEDEHNIVWPISQAIEQVIDQVIKQYVKQKL